jgi:RNA polymerase sigma factor (sigma-70 family)
VGQPPRSFLCLARVLEAENGKCVSETNVERQKLIKGVDILKAAELDENGYIAHIQDLKASYRETLRIVRDSKNRCDAELTLENNGAESVHHDSIIKDSIIKDLNLMIDWLHLGRMRGGRRGAERRPAHQMKRCIDPLRMQSYSDNYNSRSASTLTKDQMELLQDALCKLTESERLCYMLSHGQKTPYSEIAALLGVSIRTVRGYIDRGALKVAYYLELNLFEH